MNGYTVKYSLVTIRPESDCFYPPPQAEGYSFVHVHPSVHPSIWSHNLVTAEQNFLKLIYNMYHNNNVMHVTFGQAGFGSS